MSSDDVFEKTSMLDGYEHCYASCIPSIYLHVAGNMSKIEGFGKTNSQIHSFANMRLSVKSKFVPTL
jgi:hypothetical protein